MVLRLLPPHVTKRWMAHLQHPPRFSRPFSPWHNHYPNSNSCSVCPNASSNTSIWPLWETHALPNNHFQQSKTNHSSFLLGGKKSVKIQRRAQCRSPNQCWWGNFSLLASSTPHPISVQSLALIPLPPPPLPPFIDNNGCTITFIHLSRMKSIRLTRKTLEDEDE